MLLLAISSILFLLSVGHTKENYWPKGKFPSTVPSDAAPTDMALVEACHKEGNCTSSSCVDITGETYCGVTEGWTPRLSETGVWTAAVVLTLYAVLMMCLMFYWVKKNYSISFWESIKEVYNKNKTVISATFACRDYANKDYEKLFGKDSANNHEGYSKISDNNYSTYEIKEAQAFLKIPLIPVKYMKLPKQLGVILMTLSVLSPPICKAVWDVIDVATDGYYFVQLETGAMFSTNITRNTNVNNAVLAFAMLGAVKSTLVGLIHLAMFMSYRDERYRVHVVLAAQVLVCMQMLLQDGPEILLHYFYLDKYTTGNQPWWLLGKHVTTVVVYVWPLKNTYTSGFSDYLIVRYHGERIWGKPDPELPEGKGRFKNTREPIDGKDTVEILGGKAWAHNVALGGKACSHTVYIPAVLAHTLFSLVLITRAVAVMCQYSTGYIPRHCLEVTDAGKLIQTPIDTACMNPADWVIIVSIPVVLLVSVLVASYGLFKLYVHRLKCRIVRLNSI